jgi:quercetin dioxygenase-like cupin family protein
MQKLSLDAKASEHLEQAIASSAGRSAEAVYGGQALRQMLIALRAGASLADHENPGEVTVQVLRGRVRLHSGESSVEGMAGDLLVVPPARHSLEAVEDAVALLTVTKAP